MKLGSHFDGIAGFPLAATINGIEPVWATEIEPFPIKVSKAHFPGMKHYGSISDISGAELEPVDIITFGSPCQDLSVAGKRAGLGGERSGLFMEAVRTIREMRDATNGVYPRFAVWENVPGALSSAGGADFRAVLEELCEAEIPIPRSGKWSNAGVVRGNGREVAWRILDAQYWGVPQRRRRIFLVCDFAGQRAAEILFEQPCLPGHFKESGGPGQDAPGSAGGGIKTAGKYWDGGAISDTLDCSVLAKRQTMPEKRRMAAVVIPFTERGREGGRSLEWQKDKMYCLTNPGDGGRTQSRMIAYGPGGQGEIGHALRSAPSKADKPSSTTYVVEPTFGFSAGQSDKARTIGFQKEVTPTLRAGASGTNMTPTILEPVAFTQNQREEVRDLGDKAGSLAAEPGMHQQTYVIQNDTRGKSQNGLGVSDKDISYTLDSLGNHAVAFGGSSFGQYVEGKVSTLKSSGGDLGGGSETFVKQGYAVRRLTPTECERLQGFPDSWTDIPGASDTGRYKALGNSVAIPCVEWIMRRIAQGANR